MSYEDKLDENHRLKNAIAALTEDDHSDFQTSMGKDTASQKHYDDAHYTHRTDEKEFGKIQQFRMCNMGDVKKGHNLAIGKYKYGDGCAHGMVQKMEHHDNGDRTAHVKLDYDTEYGKKGETAKFKSHKSKGHWTDHEGYDQDLSHSINPKFVSKNHELMHGQMLSRSYRHSEPSPGVHVYRHPKTCSVNCYDNHATCGHEKKPLHIKYTSKGEFKKYGDGDDSHFSPQGPMG